MAHQSSTPLCLEEEYAGCLSNSCCFFMKRKLGLHTLRELSEGGQGIVFLCTDEAHGICLACKTIRSHAQRCPDVISHPTSRQINQHGCKKRKLNANDAADGTHVHQSDLLPSSSGSRKLSAEEVWEDTQLRWEAEVLHHLKGIPGILLLICTFEGDDSCFHLLTAFCNAGDLLSKLLDSPLSLFKLSHHEVAPIVASLAQTLAACHARGIVHRDIKPGNILFCRVHGKDREEVVLPDFGFAAAFTRRETLYERVRTPRYQAPYSRTDHLHHDAADEAIYHAILCNKLQLEGSNSHLQQRIFSGVSFARTQVPGLPWRRSCIIRGSFNISTRNPMSARPA